jgi:hypothetical protein
MKRKQRHEISSLSLSFLDAVTCGFGAIILLLVIAKIFEPIQLEESDSQIDNLIVRYEQELNEILGQTDEVRRQQRVTQEQVALSDTQIEDDIEAEIATRLAAARQSLTDEMERLIDQSRPRPRDYVVGGIPVDSEYIIFIIDTSPSMKSNEWDRVQEQISETLQVYPTVKGIQVLNDEGEHMFLASRNEWMEDSPVLRQRIISELRDWDAYSNSNPRRGIVEAIRRYVDPDKKISLYVYSDDFAEGGGTINSVVREVDYVNRSNAAGECLVRIHAVAFPVFYDRTGQMYTGADYAILMRILTQRNCGTFVALPSRRAD